ncbi:MAG: alpha/beta hydrolase [Pseudomonadota bacterium]
MTDARPLTLDPFGSVDPETQAFVARLEEVLAAAPPPGSVPVEAVRQLRAEGKGVLPVHGPLPEGAWVEIDPDALGVPGASAGPRRVRVIEAEHGRAPRALIIHLHGGGWTFGAAEQADGRCLSLARATGAMTVSISYRLAPEHVWPACADDALAGALWSIEEASRRGDGAPLPVFITGDSAGAHLAAVTLLRLRDLGRLNAITGAVFIYGCFDLRMTPSMRNWGERNLVLSTPIVDWFLGNLLGERKDDLAAAPEVSPLLADLSGMPPALFQVGGLDPLLDDSVFMAERWRAAGAQTALKIWPGAPHAFDYFDRDVDKLPIAPQSNRVSTDFIQTLI